MALRLDPPSLGVQGTHRVDAVLKRDGRGPATPPTAVPGEAAAFRRVEAQRGLVHGGEALRVTEVSEVIDLGSPPRIGATLCMGLVQRQDLRRWLSPRAGVVLPVD